MRHRALFFRVCGWGLSFSFFSYFWLFRDWIWWKFRPISKWQNLKNFPTNSVSGCSSSLLFRNFFFHPIFFLFFRKIPLLSLHYLFISILFISLFFFLFFLVYFFGIFIFRMRIFFSLLSQKNFIAIGVE